jgi:hypothetical protein
MKLQPVTQEPQTSYPTRKARLFNIDGRWIRRIGAIACASAAFWTVGCFGINPGGDVAYPEYFVCSYNGTSTNLEELSYPGTFSGDVCGTDAVEGTLAVGEQVTLRFSVGSDMDGSPNDVSVHIIDPGGHIEATATPSEPAVVELSPGDWNLAAVPDGSGDRSFSITIDLLPDE